MIKNLYVYMDVYIKIWISNIEKVDIVLAQLREIELQTLNQI